MLKKVDDIVFLLPKNKECKNINEILKNIKLSNYSLNLETINIDKSTITLIFISFIFFISFFIIGSISYKKELSKIEQKKENLAKYNLPLTTFQLDAIYSDLKKTDKKQTQIRKDLEVFSRTPLKKNEEYIKLIFDKNYKIKIKTSKNLDNYFSKYFKIINSTFKNSIYKATLKYE